MNQHEHIKNVLYNLNNHQYFSFNHKVKMINEYNNPTLLSCMFPSLFPFGFNVLEMTNRPIKASLQTHIKHLMNFDETRYIFSKHHLFPFFVFNVIQRRQICLGVKLNVSRSLNMNEIFFLNKLQSTNFDEIIKNAQNINGNTNINKLLCHIKAFNKYVMTFGSSCTTQKDQIFSMINFMGTPSLFFTLNLAFVHHLLIFFNWTKH